MSLYIRDNKSYIAKEDIVVYKCVTKKSDGNYYTLYYEMPVKLNSVLKPDYEIKKVVMQRDEKYVIESGVIHAFTYSLNKKAGREIYLNAVIKKGTEFWVQEDLREIGARELFVTDEVVEDFHVTDFREYLEVDENDIERNKDGVKVGDYRLSDGSFVSSVSKTNRKDVVGVVCYFKEDGTPVCVATSGVRRPWLKKYINGRINANVNYFETLLENDLDGKKHTEDISKSEDFDAGNFMAVNYCLNYSTKGTEKGDWYLPSVGECLKIRRNLLFINLSLFSAWFSTIESDALFWSSSVSDGNRECNLVWVNQRCGTCGWNYSLMCEFFVIPCVCN